MLADTFFIFTVCFGFISLYTFCAGTCSNSRPLYGLGAIGLALTIVFASWGTMYCFEPRTVEKVEICRVQTVDDTDVIKYNKTETLNCNTYFGKDLSAKDKVKVTTYDRGPYLSLYEREPLRKFELLSR